ncbi:MAG: tetratricopeptide repeat protein [Pirellulales bacterium]|nr:tetratricopeptide repeat protein [Pirellulales bacterium]
MAGSTFKQLSTPPSAAAVAQQSLSRRRGWSPLTWSKPARGLASAAVVVAATVAVYYPVVGHQFLNYDDPPNITDNTYYRPFTWRNIRQLWLRPYSGVYVPVTSMFWAAEVAIARSLTPVVEATKPATPTIELTALTGGASKPSPVSPADGAAATKALVEPPPDPNKLLDPRVFHVGNLLLHVVSALGVLLLLRRVTGSEIGALAGALLFTIHPVQVESVSWVTETKGLLCAVFSWGAILGYLRFVESARGSSQSRGAIVYLAAATLCFALSLLSKPMAVSVPIMAAVIAIGWYRPGWRQLAPLAVWMLLALALAAITKTQQQSEDFEFVAPWSARPFIASDAVAFYLGKLLWPVGLSTDYGRSPRWLVERPGLLYTTWLAPAVVLTLLVVLRPLRTERTLRVALGLFLAGLAPLLGFIPFGYQDNSTVADRYMYLAMIGPALLVAWGVAVMANRGGTWLKGTAAAVAVLTIVLGVLAHRQCLTWKDSERVAVAGLATNPDSPLLRQILAVELTRRGQDDAALIEYQRAAANDRLARGQLLLGMAYARRHESAKAMACFRRGLELQPNNASCHHVMAESLRNQGDHDAAMLHYQAAVRLDPNSTPTHLSLAAALGRADRWAQAVPEIRAALRLQTEDAGNWNTLAQALERTGDREGAITAYREVLRLVPDEAAPYVNLGTALWQAGQLNEAVAAYARALDIEPQNPHALRNSGLALLSLNQLDAAAGYFDRLLGADPKQADALYNLAEIRNRQGRSDEAYALYIRSVTQNPRLADAQAALASLCDRLGRTAEAAEHYRAALELQPNNAVLHNNFGVLLYKSGDTGKAAEHLARAVEISPGYAEARGNLEVVRRALDKP